MTTIYAPEAPTFRVLTNTQGRHALWPAHKQTPAGWKEALAASAHADCLAYVRRCWTGPRSAAAQPATKTLGFGLFFFGGDEGDSAWEKYEFVIKAARYADEAGFAAVWLPERHFTPMGSLYPNPAVLHAALARETKHIRLRAGSVVLPLHDPLRVAEEWALVDNLSKGRVELSIAPGWNAEDFALHPERWPRRYDIMYENVKVLDRLWSGQTVEATDGVGGKIHIRTYPTPIQKHLTKWITAAGSPQSFQQAGRIGADLLTHLFDQSVEELAEKIALYRQARSDNGWDPNSGRVAVALHTYVAGSFDEVRRNAREPYCKYLKGNLKLIEKLAQSRNIPIDIKSLTPTQLDQVLDFVFEKFVHQRSLMGTVESCTELLTRLADIGVQEIACLLDFGPAPQVVLDSLPKLRVLKDRFAQAGQALAR